MEGSGCFCNFSILYARCGTRERVYDYTFLIVKSYSILPVENGAACYTHDTSFVHIASGSTLVCDGGLVYAHGNMPSYKHRKDTAMSRTVVTKKTRVSR